MERPGKRVIARTTVGLKRESKSLKTTTYLLRFETEAQLCLLRSIFGDTVTCGVRRRRPKVGTSKYLQENDNLSFVVGYNETEVPFVKRTVRTGVDLRYDQRNLTVAIRYEKYQYTVDEQGKSKSCPSAHLASTIDDVAACADDSDDASSTADAVQLGAYFEWQERIVKVIAVRPRPEGAQDIYVTVLDGPRIQRGPLPNPINNIQQVSDLIRVYNG